MRGGGAALGRARIGQLRLERVGIATGVIDHRCRRCRRLLGRASAIRIRLGLDGAQ